MSAVLRSSDAAQDIAEAERFLTLMAEGEAVSFQTFDDDKAQRRKHLARIFHGELDAHAATLQRMNGLGAGVFWMVNYGDGEGRAAVNVTGIRALFVDLDGAPLQPVLEGSPEPHAVVESSAGRWHVYWLVSGCSLAQFEPAQRTLAAKFGGDPSVHDLPRVMRLPGFVHRKGDPFTSRIVSLGAFRPYQLEDVVQRIGIDLTAPARGQRPAEDVERAPAGEEAFKAEVKRLGRKLRTGDGRRDLLQRYIASRSARGLRDGDLKLLVDGIAARYFDPADPIDAANLAGIVQWATSRDQETERNNAELASRLVAPSAWAPAAEGIELPPVGSPTTLMSEDAMALDFVLTAEQRFRWSPGLAWMVDDGIVWRRDEQLRRYTIAREIARTTARQAAMMKGEGEARKISTAKTVNAILSLAQSDIRMVVPSDAWDRDPMALNTPQGIVSLRTGELRPRGTEYLTQSARVAPAAGSHPTWDRFIDQVFLGDRELIDFMRRAMGYGFTGDRREQVLFFWYGLGANGKSVLAEFLQWLGGSYTLKLPASALMQAKGERHPTELAQLRGKRLAVSSEIEEGSFFNEALIKELTGDTTLTARFMRQDFFEFTMQHKHVVVGNFKPRLRGGDPAMARRMLLVPFLASFKGSARDPNMLDKLKAEAPAILHWIVRGAMDWAAEGHLEPSQAVRAASAEYMSDHDDLALWVEECCERTGETKALDLYESFVHWKKARGEHAQSMTSWSSRLGSISGIEKRKSSVIWYVGLSLTCSERQRLANDRNY